MLLPRLQCKAVSWLAFRIVRDADQPPRHVTFIFVTGGKVRGVWSAKSEGHTEALRIPDRDVGAEFARRF